MEKTKKEQKGNDRNEKMSNRRDFKRKAKTQENAYNDVWSIARAPYDKTKIS